jgi:hypothetical protein
LASADREVPSGGGSIALGIPSEFTLNGEGGRVPAPAALRLRGLGVLATGALSRRRTA